MALKDVYRYLMHLCYELIERLVVGQFAEMVCVPVEYDFAESHCHW